jgi:hypothetical protein
MEHEAVGIQVLKNFDVPVRCTVRKCRHVNDQEILSKPMHPWWLSNVPFEFPLCVDVEDEAAPWRQMSTHPGKYSPPVGEAPNCDLWSRTRSKSRQTGRRCANRPYPAGKVLLEALCGAHREHSAGSIQPGHFVMALQMAQH